MATNNNNCNCNTPMMEISPDEDIRRWCVRQTVTVLANADLYYTSAQVDKLIHDIDPGISKEEAEELIYQATSGKQNTLIAGTGISIVDDVISVTGGGITSGEVQNMIDESISGKSDTTAVTAVNDALTAHTSNTDIHVTTNDKQAWNAKADLSDIPSVSGYADSVMYNSSTHYVEFYHDTSKVFEYDASPFIIDGMVENVEIKDVIISGESVTCLVVSFNTDAGHQDINIPISEIFDASNYVDIATYSAYTASTDTALAGKQATLENQVNIKSVNGNSLLGSGNIDIQGGNNVTVSGSTLVFN